MGTEVTLAVEARVRIENAGRSMNTRERTMAQTFIVRAEIAEYGSNFSLFVYAHFHVSDKV
jgi:hypothetical protein